MSFDSARTWLDPDIGRVSIGAHLRPGANTIELSCTPFTMLNEIAPVYVLGGFAVLPAEKGFEIAPPAPIPLGNRVDHGHPFYPGPLRYTFTLDLSEDSCGLELSLPDWRGASARVSLDGEHVGTVLHPPYALDVRHDLPAGRHELWIDVVGTLRNLLGSHFSDAPAGPWSWEAAPGHLPPGQNYAFPEVGLCRPPRVSCVMLPPG